MYIGLRNHNDKTLQINNLKLDPPITDQVTGWLQSRVCYDFQELVQACAAMFTSFRGKVCKIFPGVAVNANIGFIAIVFEPES